MKKYLIPLVCLFLLVGCSSQNNNSGDPAGGNGGSDIEKVKTISFYNGGFTNSTLDREQSQKNFIDWMNNGEDVIKSIDYSGYCQLNYVGDKNDENRFTTLYLGNQNGGGQLVFHFNYQVKKVKLNVQAYCKYIEYTSKYNIDSNSKFYLDSDEYDLSTEEGYNSETEKKDIVKQYNPEIEQISIASAEGRVFVHSMEITYIA